MSPLWQFLRACDEGFSYSYAKLVPTKVRKGVEMNLQRDFFKYCPNSFVCQGCPEWDDVNGCWELIDDWRYCGFINEFGVYDEGAPYEDEWEPQETGDWRVCSLLSSRKWGVV